MKFLITNPRLLEKGPPALGITSVAQALSAELVFVAPAPHRTMAKAVVCLPESAAVRVGAGCFVYDCRSHPGALVDSGEILIACEDPLLSWWSMVIGLKRGRSGETGIQPGTDSVDAHYGAGHGGLNGSVWPSNPGWHYASLLGYIFHTGFSGRMSPGNAGVHIEA